MAASVFHRVLSTPMGTWNSFQDVQLPHSENILRMFFKNELATYFLKSGSHLTKKFAFFGSLKAL